MSDLVKGSDGLLRPAWASADDLQRDYYDHEWGNPVRSESGVFERLALEGFQSGLSWAVVLRKRPRFREVFHNFDVDAVAAFTEDDVVRLLADPGIIRNRAKIEATIGNAQRTIDLRADGGLAALVWSYEPAEQPAPRAQSDIGLRPEAVALAQTLKKRGFRYVGPTTMQALLEAIGVLNHHLVGSHRRPDEPPGGPSGTPHAQERSQVGCGER